MVAASTRFQHTYRVLSRRAQDQQGDLATYVEEAATGIRVLKALGRGGEAAGQHRGQALEVFTTELQKARLRSVLRDAMCVDDAETTGVYFGTRTGEVFASRDEGDSWHQVAAHLPDVLCVRAATV